MSNFIVHFFYKTNVALQACIQVFPGAEALFGLQGKIFWTGVSYISKWQNFDFSAAEYFESK